MDFWAPRGSGVSSVALSQVPEQDTCGPKPVALLRMTFHCRYLISSSVKLRQWQYLPPKEVTKFKCDKSVNSFSIVLNIKHCMHVSYHNNIDKISILLMTILLIKEINNNIIYKRDEREWKEMWWPRGEWARRADDGILREHLHSVRRKRHRDGLTGGRKIKMSSEVKNRMTL